MWKMHTCSDPEVLAALIREVAEESKRKPHRYKHTCWAGTSVIMLSTWNDDEVIDCPNHGRWQGPNCKCEKGCDGKHKGLWLLSDYQNHINSGIETLTRELINRIRA